MFLLSLKGIIFIITFFILLFLFIIFLSGTRVKIDETLHKINLPDNLDNYLKDSESKYTDITPDTEKIIKWYNKEKIKTKYSVVYIHGFSATRHECEPVTDMVADYIKANVFYTRLTAHGRGQEPFKNVTVNDWLNDINEALAIANKIGNNVIIVGMSTAAPLIMWLVKNNPDIKAVILISPNFGLANKYAKLLLLPWGNVLSRLFIGKYYGFKPRNELHAKYWTTKYRVEGLLQMTAIVDYSQKIDFSLIQIPCLFIYSENDEVVDIEWLKKVYKSIGSKNKKIIDLPGAKDHMITGDILCPETTKPCVNFIIDFLNENKIIKF